VDIFSLQDMFKTFIIFYKCVSMTYERIISKIFAKVNQAEMQKKIILRLYNETNFKKHIDKMICEQIFLHLLFATYSN